MTSRSAWVHYIIHPNTPGAMCGALVSKPIQTTQDVSSVTCQVCLRYLAEETERILGAQTCPKCGGLRVHRDSRGFMRCERCGWPGQ